MGTVGEKKRVGKVDQTVGRQVRLARRAREMSLERLAEHLDMSPQQVQKYEAGLNRISSATLFDISQILGQPVAYFFGEYTDNPQIEDRDARTPGYQDCLALLNQVNQPVSFTFIKDYLELALLREQTQHTSP